MADPELSRQLDRIVFRLNVIIVLLLLLIGGGVYLLLGSPAPAIFFYLLIALLVVGVSYFVIRTQSGHRTR